METGDGCKQRDLRCLCDCVSRPSVSSRAVAGVPPGHAAKDVRSKRGFGAFAGSLPLFCTWSCRSSRSLRNRRVLFGKAWLPAVRRRKAVVGTSDPALLSLPLDVTGCSRPSARAVAGDTCRQICPFAGPDGPAPGCGDFVAHIWRFAVDRLLPMAAFPLWRPAYRRRHMPPDGLQNPDIDAGLPGCSHWLLAVLSGRWLGRSSSCKLLPGDAGLEMAGSASRTRSPPAGALALAMMAAVARLCKVASCLFSMWRCFLPLVRC